MQMCEGSDSDIPGTERLLLIGKHTQLQAAGSQPRDVRAPWEPEAVLRRRGRGGQQEEALRRHVGAPSPPPTSPGGKSLRLPGLRLPHL